MCCCNRVLYRQTALGTLLILWSLAVLSSRLRSEICHSFFFFPAVPLRPSVPGSYSRYWQILQPILISTSAYDTGSRLRLLCGSPNGQVVVSSINRSTSAACPRGITARPRCAGGSYRKQGPQTQGPLVYLLFGNENRPFEHRQYPLPLTSG